MKTQMLDIKMQDGVCDSFIAYPDDKKQYPAVLLLMDAFGPRDYLYDMAKTIAVRGYYVLLPNLFYRTRRAPVIDAKFPLRAEQMPELIKTQLMPLFHSYTPAMQGMQDAGVFLDFLAQQKQALPGKVGLTGYCMGGSLAIRIAAQYPDRIAAVASFHGGNLATEMPESPHLLLGKIKAKLYIAHADNDQSMPPEQITRFREALDKSGHKDVEAEVYTGAAHGFTMADLPAYNEAACKRHWEKLFGLFGDSLEEERMKATA
jgi:carboxymethylenebutenolidase